MFRARTVKIYASWFLIFVCACTVPQVSSFDDLSPQPVDDAPLHETVFASPIIAPSFSILPDAELVNSPSAIGFDTLAFVTANDGYLASYTEEVQGQLLNGAEIITKISHEYSVHPRLLLAILEYQSAWVTQTNPDQTIYPFGLRETNFSGLYKQLSWAANQLNRGYYLHRVGGLQQVSLFTGQTIALTEQVNSATAAVQYLFSLLMNYHEWQLAVSPLGLQAIYLHLFGDPWQFDTGEVVPEDASQPEMRLPFASGESWYFTSGPHSAWGDGAAWAALDFAPPGNQFGCYESDDWVLAVADGMVVRSENGVVVLDLDSDGFEQTGWSVLYLHIAERDRVSAGAYLNAGGRIGHPSCEGGLSSGTHVHIARRYNGEWIPADQQLPFNLSGWISQEFGSQYNGRMVKNGKLIEASGFPAEENQIYW